MKRRMTMMTYKEVLVSILGPCLFMASVQTSMVPCNPDIPGCNCQSTLMQCSGLKTLPTTNQIPSNVKELRFEKCASDNDFIKLSKSVLPEYSSATVLYLEDCHITEVEADTFASLSNLEYLSLGGNYLKNVTKDMFSKLSKLETLHLKNNELTTIAADAFANLPALTELNLEYNRGLVLPDSVLDGHDELSKVFLGHCDLKSVPTSALAKAPGITHLVLDHNNFAGTLQDDSFAELTSLVSLNLDSCQINSIADNAFRSLNKLSYLNIGFNLLTEVTKKQMDHFRSTIKKILLESNRLKSLDKDVLPWQQIEKVQLGSNSWKCDCDIVWMHDIGIGHKDPENVTCVEPDSLKGKNLFNVSKADVCESCDVDGNCEKRGKSVVALAIAIPVLIILAALIAYYLYQIYKNRRARAGASQRKGAGYSPVYKDTVESAHPPSSTRPTSEI